MAKEKTQDTQAEGTLTAVAKKIGRAVGTLASAAGVSPEAGSLPSEQPAPKVPKLERKDKSRLPRREKKALQKRLAK